jgi:hypothetical protein
MKKTAASFHQPTMLIGEERERLNEKVSLFYEAIMRILQGFPRRVRCAHAIQM